MIGLRNAALLRCFQYVRLLSMVTGTLLIGSVATGCASANTSVSPYVRLQPGFTEHQVTGNIYKHEWKKKEYESETCWEGKLLTFKVFQSNASSGNGCDKKGVWIPYNVHETKNVIIFTDCEKSFTYPPATVRICQPQKPGDLKFDFNAQTSPGEKDSLKVKAENFKVAGKSPRSFNANLSPDRALHFLLNFEPKKVFSGDITDGTSAFLPFLGRDLFIETYSADGSSPSGRGVTWPDPSIPLNWADVQGNMQSAPDYINLHTKLGVMKCMPAINRSWEKLQLADCFDGVKLRQGMENLHLFLILERASDISTVIKGYRGGEQERSIRLPRMVSENWQVKDLRAASPHGKALSESKAAAETYSLADFVKPGIHPATDNQKDDVSAFAFAAPEHTVLEIMDRSTGNIQIRVFDDGNRQILQFHAGEYRLNAYLEGHDVFSDLLNVKQIGEKSLLHQIHFQSKSKSYTGQQTIKIEPKPTEYTDMRIPVIQKMEITEFLGRYGTDNISGLYVRFSGTGSSTSKFDIPVTAKMYSDAALKRYDNFSLHDEDGRFKFDTYSTDRMNLPLINYLQPDSVRVATKVFLSAIPEDSLVKLKYSTANDWSRPFKKQQNSNLWYWLRIADTADGPPATEAFNLRACSASEEWHASIPSIPVSNVLGSKVYQTSWDVMPVPENTLVFLSGDSATSEKQLTSDGAIFFITAANAIKKHQLLRQSISGATIVYGMGMDDQFRQYTLGNQTVLPTEYGGMQDLDQALNSALSILRLTAQTAGEPNYSCPAKFRLIYFGYAPSLNTRKVPETFGKVDVVTPVEANAEEITSSSRFNVHVVSSVQAVYDQLEALFSVRTGGNDGPSN